MMDTAPINPQGSSLTAQASLRRAAIRMGMTDHEIERHGRVTGLLQTMVEFRARRRLQTWLAGGFEPFPEALLMDLGLKAA